MPLSRHTCSHCSLQRPAATAGSGKPQQARSTQACLKAKHKSSKNNKFHEHFPAEPAKASKHATQVCPRAIHTHACRKQSYNTGVTAARALPRESRSARDSAAASAAGCGLLHVAASIRGSPSAFTPFFTCEQANEHN